MTAPEAAAQLRVDLVRLGVMYEAFGPWERQVLMRVAERLVKGQRRYGTLDMARDVRDWLEEQQQERLDELVYGEIYLAAQDVRRGEARR